MPQISIKSETFLIIYTNLRPVLEQLDKQRQGFNRPITLQMDPFRPSQVLSHLDGLCKVAEQAIALAGTDASHVVLKNDEIQMITWIQSLENQYKLSDI